ncbi:MAG: hypothetical protein ACK5W5_14680, partial [Cyanobacteriota bacterium]
MAKESNPPAHPLPTRGDNIFYILTAIFSPAINFLIHHFVYAHGGGINIVGVLSWFLAFSPLLLNGVLILLLINILHAALGLHHRQSRKTLLAFGVFSSLYLIINLITITYGIVKFRIQSLDLLLVSISVYASINLIFVFWYWYFDYPSQLRRLQHPGATPEICFPISSRKGENWVPGFLDYLYFSILTSNTLGPPENHSPAGQKAKSVVLLHSLVMLVVLVIFLSRAINTLPSVGAAHEPPAHTANNSVPLIHTITAAHTQPSPCSQRGAQTSPSTPAFP